MTVKVVVKNSDNTQNSELYTSADLVLSQFQNLPTLPLLAFFDDEDAPFFRKRGHANRGSFEWSGLTIEWPYYLKDKMCDALDRSSITRKRLFNLVIYIHGTTCIDPVGRVMTFAHELQHFVQYGCHRRLWAESHLLQYLLPSHEIPIEREARIKAKRVAEELCNAQELHRYMVGMAAGGADSEDVDGWRFIREFDTSTAYDLDSETRFIFQNHPEWMDTLKTKLDVWKQKYPIEFKDIDLSLY